MLYRNSLFYEETNGILIFPLFGNPHNDLRVALKGTPNNEKCENRDFRNPHNDLRVALKGTPNNEKRKNRDVKFHIMISFFPQTL